MNVRSTSVLRFSAIATFALLIGCASAKVSNETSNVAPGAPSMIYIENFDLGAAKLKADPGTLTGRPRLIKAFEKDPVKKLEELSDTLAKTIVDDLNKAKYPAQRFAGDAPRPTSGWLISGRFGEVVEGNRVQTAVVGFGVGESNTHLYVSGADLSQPAGKQDLLGFDVDSEGSKAPGGGATSIVTHTPWGMAAKFVLDRDASTKDVERAGHLIAQKIVKLAQKKAE